MPPLTFTSAISGDSFSTNQCGKIHATVNAFAFSCSAMVVADLDVDIILGMPWLTEHKAVIDVTRGCVHLGTNQRRTLHFHRQAPPAPKRPKLDPSSIAVRTEGWTTAQQRDFHRTMDDFGELFAEGGAVTTTATTEHTIRLKDATPVRVAPYRYSPEKKRIITEQVEKMLAANVIRPSHSEYNSPIVIVSKKNGEPRFCVDYRRLNDKTEDEVSPLPPIQEALKDLGTARIFTTLDLRNGYWQIKMTETSKPLTAFTTPDGAAYEFQVMPFGLKSAPTTFQKLMAQDVLVGYLRDFTIAYLDDIIIFSDNMEDHLRHLRLVFERLTQHGLRLNLDKCEFVSHKLDYLGHVVTSDGNQPQEAHVAAIQAATPPRSRKALRQFLGLINWLRDYIPGCSSTMAALTDLLSTKKTFAWTRQANAAFLAIKEAAARPMFLHRPDFKLPFVLQTDASGIGGSAVLYQEGPAQERHVVSYASVRFNKTEQKYHINEQECLAVVWAIKRYRPYLEDKPFTLRTDSKALTWLHQFRESKSKLMRWSLLLQEFQYSVEHVPGKANELPDALSRNPGTEEIATDLGETDRLLPYEYRSPNVTHPIYLTVAETPLLHQIQDGQRDDERIQNIVDRIRQGNRNEPPWLLRDGLLRYQLRNQQPIYVPQATRAAVIHHYHDNHMAGHPGTEETMRAIRARFYWEDMRPQVADHVTCCRICNAFKRGPLQTPAPLRPHAPTSPFEVISVDIIGPMTTSRSGNRFGIVAQDLYSRWIEVKAVRSATSPTIAEFLDSLFQRFGYPMAVLTDNGPQFTSIAWDAALRRWQCMHWTTPIYHPRANPVERKNQDIKKGLRIHLEGNTPERWDEKLGTVQFNLRCRQNAATGYTPAKALFGYDLQRPGDWRDPRANEAEPAEDRVPKVHANEMRYRERRYVRPNAPMPIQPTIQDFVMVKSHPPPGRHFGPRWIGPYPVVELAGPTAIWVERPGGQRAKYHLDQVRIARQPPRAAPHAGQAHNPEDGCPQDQNRPAEQPPCAAPQTVPARSEDGRLREQPRRASQQADSTSRYDEPQHHRPEPTAGPSQDPRYR